MTVDYIPFTELLSDIIDNRGRTCPTSTTGFPLIATNCIRNDLLYPVFENIRYVSKETIETWFRGHPEPGDIIFVNKGTPGRVCMVPDPVSFCIAQDMVAIRADQKKIYPKYLFAVLRSSDVQTQIENMHVGTLIPHFKKGDFDKLLIPVPDKKTQEIIGNNYFTLSHKIELNRRMNETLEAMARANFQSWFVDFDPVRAKAEGRDTGLPPEVAALFTDGFEEIDGREVPRGWGFYSISECCLRVENGGTPRRDNPEYWNPPKIPWLTSGEVRQDIITSTENMISELGFANSSAKMWPKGTTVVALYGATAGQVSLISFELCANQACCALIPKERMTYFIYLTMSSAVGSLENQASGSAQQNLSQKIIANFTVCQPSCEILKKFDKLVEPLFEKWISNLHQSRTLAQIRDAMLPKLMSGELSVDK
jgi:type I restriction enzyme S subunit